VTERKPILVVGAGLSGATVARVLAEAGHAVTVIDQRPHVAGNAYDALDEQGIRVHHYGPHLFHNSDDKVVAFLSRFTEWLPYRHRVKAMLADGRLVTLPVNRETAAIVGKDKVLDVFFRPYSRKMWGLELEQLDPAILQRVPVRDDLNEDYFPNDTFQALPRDGYTAMVQRMLAHEHITVSLNTPFEHAMEDSFQHVFNAMSIDDYFDHRFGTLPYRSIRFHHQRAAVPQLFPVATVNFTHDEPFTRVTEWKHLPGHGNNPAWTSLTVEEPCDFRDNHLERYYPVKDLQGENRALYQRYAALVPPHVTFIGRCGLYAYLDMHQAVSSALATAKKFLDTQSPDNVTLPKGADR
jgi:UDP-galactopyranose mutase